MSAFAITLCVLASVSFGVVATITIVKTIINAGFDDRRDCAHCAVRVGHCMVECDGPPTEIVCSHCFRYGPPRPADTDAEFEELDAGERAPKIARRVAEAR